MGLNASFFSSLFFLLLSFFSLPSTLVPPFNPLSRKFVKSWECLHLTDEFITQFSLSTSFTNILKNFYQLARDNFLRSARNFFYFAVTNENVNFIFVTLHSRIRTTHIIRYDNVAILFSKFFSRIRFELLRFSREAHHKVVPIFWERRENVLRWNKLEGNVLGALFNFAFGNFCGLVIRNRGAHHQNVAARRVLVDRFKHFVTRRNTNQGNVARSIDIDWSGN